MLDPDINQRISEALNYLEERIGNIFFFLSRKPIREQGGCLRRLTPVFSEQGCTDSPLKEVCPHPTLPTLIPTPYIPGNPETGSQNWRGDFNFDNIFQLAY